MSYLTVTNNGKLLYYKGRPDTFGGGNGSFEATWSSEKREAVGLTREKANVFADRLRGTSMTNFRDISVCVNEARQELIDFSPT